VVLPRCLGVDPGGDGDSRIDAHLDSRTDAVANPDRDGDFDPDARTNAHRNTGTDTDGNPRVNADSDS
jgi:hypothetical protein